MLLILLSSLNPRIRYSFKRVFIRFIVNLKIINRPTYNFVRLYNRVFSFK